MPSNPSSSPSAGPSAGVPSDVQESRLLAALLYLLSIFTSPLIGLGILILVFIAKKDDRYLRFHAAQAVAYDILFWLVSIGLMIIGFGLWIIGLFSGAAMGVASGDSSGVGALGMIISLVSFLALPVTVLIILALYFLGPIFLAYKAYKGVEYRLPIVGKMIANAI